MMTTSKTHTNTHIHTMKLSFNWCERENILMCIIFGCNLRDFNEKKMNRNLLLNLLLQNFQL